MIEAFLTIDFLTEWHCGSGVTGGADLDLIALRDEEGFPFVPARTIKGLLREQYAYVDASSASTLFGNEDDQNGLLIIDDALMSSEDAASINDAMKPLLFRRVVSTQLKEHIAVDHTMRAIEYAVPLKLYAPLTLPEEYFEHLALSAGMIKSIGLGKFKGFGACHVTIRRNDHE